MAYGILLYLHSYVRWLVIILAILLVLAAIPWPFLSIGRPLLRF